MVPILGLLVSSVPAAPPASASSGRYRPKKRVDPIVIKAEDGESVWVLMPEEYDKLRKQIDSRRMR